MPPKARKKVAPAVPPAETSGPSDAQPLANKEVKKRKLDLSDAEDIPGKKVLTFIDVVILSEADYSM
jgi:hypothetical protein